MVTRIWSRCLIGVLHLIWKNWTCSRKVSDTISRQRVLWQSSVTVPIEKRFCEKAEILWRLHECCFYFSSSWVDDGLIIVNVSWLPSKAVLLKKVPESGNMRKTITVPNYNITKLAVLSKNRLERMPIYEERSWRPSRPWKKTWAQNSTAKDGVCRAILKLCSKRLGPS